MRTNGVFGALGRRGWCAGLLCLVMAFGTPVNASELVKFSGGEVITGSDLSQYLERRVDLRGSSRNKWGVEAILREMALTRALVQEGVRMGEARLPGKESERFDDVYAFSVFKKLSPPCDPPADAAATRKFYDDNPKAFVVPPMARLGRVMLPFAEPVEGMAAADWMMARAKAIASGAKTFDDVAKEADAIYRLEPQGDLGWVVLVDENAILRTLASAKAGDMVGPVREGDFVYLFSIADKREGRQLAWSEVEKSAATRAVSYCRQTSRKALEEGLIAKYGVTLNQAGINALFEKPPAK